LNAAVAVFAPVPPLAIGNTPVMLVAALTPVFDPVPPEDTGSGFVSDTCCVLLIVIAVVSPVWISNELSLSPVEINPPGDVVVLFILDGI
jgi:hypothetical protein